MMTEGDEGVPESGDGLVFHEGSRLTDLKIQQNLSIDYPRLEPLHHLKIELMFHYYKIKTTWTRSHWITLIIGFLAVITAGWDFGINELTGNDGSHFYTIGVWPGDVNSGINHIDFWAGVMTIVTLGLWALLLIRLWIIFPLMRSQTVSLFLALFAAEVSQFLAHGYDARFPFGFDAVDYSFAIAVSVVGMVLIIFVAFILIRAVIETRDLHVEERHWHTDPRQMDLARRDHSLIAWVFALLAYCTIIIIHAWAGAHYVSVRQPGDVSGWWLLKGLYTISGFMLITLMMHVLWYPQIMLGTAEIRIESDRARQVGTQVTTPTIAESSQPGRPGKCPDCGEITTVTMRPNGEINAECAIDGCNGNGTPGEKCPICATRISSRIICLACNTSAPVGSHFSDDEAW